MLAAGLNTPGNEGERLGFGEGRIAAPKKKVMSSIRSRSTALMLAALALSVAACGSLPRTAPTQPPMPSQAG